MSFHGGTTTAEATDGSCMAVAASPHCANGELEIILHQKALTTLDSIVKPDEELYVGITGKFAVFMKEDMFFSTMLFTGHYLEASKVFDSFQPAYHATVDAKQLYELVSSLSVIFNTGDDRCINLRVETDKVCVQVRTAICSSASHVEAADTTPTPEEGFHYQPRLLLDCLRRMVGPVRFEMDQKGFALLQAHGNRYLICPRGPARIAKKEETVAAVKEKKSRKRKTAPSKAAAKAA